MKTIYFISLLLFGVVLFITVHESIHILQAQGKIDEVCFMGYSDNAMGWIVPTYQDNLNYFNPSDFSFENVWKYTTQKEELLPGIAGLLVFTVFMTGLFYNYSKDKEKELYSADSS